MPRISVIIPIYNTEEYIYECLESLRKQTFTDFEAIIVNDGSTDRSLNIIQNFITMDARFQCITIVNSGQLLARKTGIELSKGEYITFLDGDDFVSKEWLDTLLVNIEREKSDISIIGYNLYFDNGNKYIRMSNPKLSFTSAGDEILEEWISAKHFEGFLNDKMFKKNLFSHIIWPKNIRYLEDIALLNQIIVKAKK
ncbi:glycosyltransferase family 2 protein [Leuconostoc fallax]|nr:glycosyltransferase family 2 protein [Leuconostoc fallax]